MCDQKAPEQPGWPVKGQEVYTEDGAKVIFVGEIDGCYAVRRIMWDSEIEEEYASDSIMVTGKIFQHEPVERYGSKVQSVKDRIRNLEGRHRVLCQEIQSLEDRKELLAQAAKTIPDVATIIDFLGGRITCAIVDHWQGPQIHPILEALRYIGGETREPGLKLLCLFGNEKKHQWAINNYSDGSGSWREIIPFTSDQEAEAELKRMVEKRAEEWRKSPSNNRINMGKHYVDSPYLPGDVRDGLAAIRIAARDDRIKKLKAELNGLIADRDAEASASPPPPPLG